MTEATGRRVVVQAACVPVGIEMRRRLMALGWKLHFEEVLHSGDGRRIAVAFGTTTATGGLTFLSSFARGVGSVAFLLRIEELEPTRTEVAVLAGGTEGWSGLDYGRNRGVVDRLLSGLDT